MLKHNIQALRKSKGLSQDELAQELHAVRQTISKWERGLSVPDAEMLIRMSKIFETPVSTLLGENTLEAKERTEASDIQLLSEKLTAMNSQLSQKQLRKRRAIHRTLILLSFLIVALFVALFLLGNPYASWDYSDPEYLVLGTVFHSFAWGFVRVAPIILVGLIVGAILTREKHPAIKPSNAKNKA